MLGEICMVIIAFLTSENPQIPNFKVRGQFLLFYFSKIDALNLKNHRVLLYRDIRVPYVFKPLHTQFRGQKTNLKIS